VGSLVRLVFDRMQLAGEAGPLLKIEEDLRHAIRQAKAQWQRQPKVQQLALLREFERRRIEQLEMFDLSGISDAAFWEGVEEQVFAALRAYATEAADGQATQRRLFADDAEQGFAFIDLLRQHYDVVLMNPPFGDAPLSTLSALDDQLATVGRDLGCAFVSAANRRWTPYGFTASVLSTAAWVQPSFSEWRFNNLFAEDRSLQTAAQLGGDVLDGATVNASAFTIGHKASNRAAIFRVFRSDDKALTIYSAIREIISGRASQCLYLVDLLQVGCLAGSPLAYWVSESLRNRLASLPLFQGNGGVVRQGTATGKEFRFSRAWWEIGRSNRWIPYMKSSEYSPFWDEPTWVLNFDRNGMELLATGKSRVQGTDYFGKPGVTFPSRSVLGFNPRAHPAGCAFSHTGSVVFGYRALPALILGYLSSKPIEYVLSLFTGSLQGEAGYHPQHYEVGVIQRLPWPEWDADAGAEIATHANNAALRSCGLFIGDETSHHFMAPYDFNKPSVLAIAQSERARELQAIREIIDLRGHIDLAVAPILGFTAEDIAEMDLEFAERVPPASGRWRVYFAAEPDPPDGVGTAFSMVSYAVGVLFGRWDVRLALECSLQPNLADPFSPLPVCSPGMLV